MTRALSLSLLPAARKARSVPSRVNVWSRARRRADLWAEYFAEWPALIETVERDAQAIEALFYGKGSKQ